jgi:hypothetical protein
MRITCFVDGCREIAYGGWCHVHAMAKQRIDAAADAWRAVPDVMRHHIVEWIGRADHCKDDWREGYLAAARLLREIGGDE